jgi:glycerol-3-phosphate O-acyltransferase
MPVTASPRPRTSLRAPLERLWHHWLRALLRRWCRPNVQGAEFVPREGAVCYVLANPAHTDIALLDGVARDRGLPPPFRDLRTDLGLANAPARAWCFLNQRMGWVLTRFVPVDHPKLLAAIMSSEADVALVPVSVFWGRAPGKHGSLLRALVSEQWSVSGRLRRLLTILLYRADILIQFGQPIASCAIRRDDGLPTVLRRTGRLLRRQLRAHRTAVLGPDLSHRRTLIDAVLRGERVRAAIAAEVAKGGDEAKLVAGARKAAQAIASDMSYIVIRFMDALLRWLWQRLYEGIHIQGLERLRPWAENHALVYVPSHRSHIDYLLLSYVLHHGGLMIPHIAAGDNLDLPVVGGLLRRSGAFFLRRSFRDDPIYAAVFAEYLMRVFARGHSVEYFIEGGRTRTGRLLDARPGLLAMTVNAAQRGTTRPLAFVPVFFGYERLFEDRSYLNELRGAKKTRESLGDILRAAARLTTSFGRAAVAFGEPLPLEAHLDATSPGWRTLDLGAPAAGDLVPGLGRTLLERINADAVLNAHHLVALVLLATPRLALSRRALIDQLDSYLVLLAHSPEGRFTALPASGEDAVARAEAQGHVVLEPDPLGAIASLPAQNAPLANWYRNNVLHTLLLALCSGDGHGLVGPSVPNRDWLRGRALLLRPFLVRELHLATPGGAAVVVDHWLERLLQDGWLYERTDGAIVLPPLTHDRWQRTALLSRAILPSLERYYIGVSLLRAAGDAGITRADLVDQCLRVARRLARLHGLDAPEFFDRRLFEAFVGELVAGGWARLDADQRLHGDHRLAIVLREGAAVVGADFRTALWQLRHRAPVPADAGDQAGA